MIEDVEIKISENVKSPIEESASQSAQEIFDCYFGFLNCDEIGTETVKEVEKQLDYGELFEEGLKLTDERKSALNKIFVATAKRVLQEQRQEYRNLLFKSIERQSCQGENEYNNEILKIKKIIEKNNEQLFTLIGDKFDRGCFINGTIKSIDVGKKLEVVYWNPNAKITTGEHLGVVIATTNIAQDFKKAFKDAQIKADALAVKKDDETDSCEKDDSEEQEEEIDNESEIEQNATCPDADKEE